MQTLSRTTIDTTSATIDKIEQKAIQLRATGLTHGDRTYLRGRLPKAWIMARAGKDSGSFRRARARGLYVDIQQLSDHLFLAAILVITPTECQSRHVDKVLETLRQMENYASFHMDLNPNERTFFETTAQERGFSEAEGYSKFMLALFPGDRPRTIEFSYSSIPLSQIDNFFALMRDGVYTSKMWTEERKRGEPKSYFVSALVPTGDRDCCYMVYVGRKAMIDALRELELTPLVA